MKEVSIKEKVIMYKEIIPYHYCSSPSIKEEERWRANEPIVIRLDIIREIVPKVNAPYVTLKVTEDCFDDIVVKSSEAEEIKNILLGNIPEKQGEQNPSTMSIDEAIEHCKEKSCGNNACALEHKQLEKWLTELKELKEQKSVEWSKEDEYMMDNLLQHLRVAYTDCEWLKKTVTWFKSICHRKRWKPSEEQMKILSIYAHVHDELASLYQDLNKLKG